MEEVDVILGSAPGSAPNVRIQKQLALGCDIHSVYLCELRRLLRQKETQKHPERMIGKREKSENESQEDRSDLPVVLMGYVLENEALMVDLLKSQRRNEALRFFFLDLLHALVKKVGTKSLQQGGKGEEEVAPLKRKKTGKGKDSSSKTAAFLSLEHLLKAALFNDAEADRGIVSLASSVEVQLLFKAVDLLYFLAETVSMENFERCVDLTCIVAQAVLPHCRQSDDEEGAVGTCRLVDRGAMLALVPARIFSLLNIYVNQALKRQNDDAVRKCSYLVRKMLGKRGLESLLALLHALSESDDDLVDALLALTEIDLRLDLASSSFSADISELYALQASEKASPPLTTPLLMPITLFLWFTQHSLCADEGVLVDMLLNPETKVLEYCLRCMKLLAGLESPSRAKLRLSLHRIAPLQGGESPVEDAVAFLGRLRTALASHTGSLRAVRALVMRIDAVISGLD